MVNVRDEIKQNYEAYVAATSAAISTNIATFSGNDHLVQSYSRVASINAIKVDLVDTHFSKEAAHFFFEAHNDALISHVNASFGSWRPALQALRSFFENTMSAIYYTDHPIELEQWKSGKYTMQPRDLRQYIVDHPRIEKVAAELNLKALLDQEYGTLSKAVHGSNILFRMTSDDGKTNIANPNIPDLGKWAARERATMNLLIVPILCVLGDHIAGAKLPNLRSIIGNTLSPASRAALKKHLNVSIAAQ
jgi:hypothetical protein